MLRARFLLVCLFHSLRIWSEQDLAAANPHPQNHGFQSYAVEVYRQVVRQRNAVVQHVYGGNSSNVIAFDTRANIFLWDLFPPVFNCPARERMGRLSEGGKVVCNPAVLAVGDNCVVFSFGVRDDISFEIELAKTTRCTIYAFDPTVDSLPGGQAELRPCQEEGTQEQGCGGRIEFAKQALGDKDDSTHATQWGSAWEEHTLDYLMAERNVSHVHLLKVDVEGDEWKVFRQLAAAGSLKRVDQVLIELHIGQAYDRSLRGIGSYYAGGLGYYNGGMGYYNGGMGDYNGGMNSGVDFVGAPHVFELFEAMEAAGLYPFSNELNLEPPARGQGPTCIEYSFVRVGSAAMARPPRLRQECLCGEPMPQHLRKLRKSRSNKLLGFLPF